MEDVKEKIAQKAKKAQIVNNSLRNLPYFLQPDFFSKA